MKYTRNRINREGDKLISEKSPEKYQEAVEIINDWRTNHLGPLEKLYITIGELLHFHNIEYVLTSQRLKRMQSIQYKLDLNPNMGLGGLYDIGGVRVVCEDMNRVVDTYNLLSKDFDDFEYITTKDYIKNPKESGYRSIHLIFKYKSIDDRYDGLRFELQIRTKLQHSWAMALETVDIHENTSLKSGQGNDTWLEFFKIVSSLFADREHEILLSEHKNMKSEDLMRKYFRHNNSKNNVSLLKAFSLSNKALDSFLIKPDYYLLNIDLSKNDLRVYTYSKDDYQEATEKYYDLEKNIDNKMNVVVLVATSSYQMLREAYPSYFSDISDFIKALELIEENCKKFGFT